MNVKCIVSTTRLNKRSVIPTTLTDKLGIVGTVTKGFEFIATEVPGINPAVGKWYKDLQGVFYWGGGLTVTQIQPTSIENISDLTKQKIMKVVNMFETGTPDGNYGMLVTYKDYKNPVTKTFEVQVTYGRSQTTEFGNLRTLLQDYVNKNGAEASVLTHYLTRIGRQPSLSSDKNFKATLKRAGNDPIMKECQDSLFEIKYYQPALNWFHRNNFTNPLSLLVIYDSYIHSGGILPFLRNRVMSPLPSLGGNEHDWITQYVEARSKWLSTHSNPILRKTIYRTTCFSDQILKGNWTLNNQIRANGTIIA